jgi:DNA-binding transcriptional regulator GbsR (MarR family)
MAGTSGMRDEARVRQMVEHLAMTLNDLGFPRMPGRVLVALMAADEDTLTAGDLAERLDVSPAAVSGAVRYLTQIGLILRQPAPGSRRDVYRLPANPWYEATMVKRQGLTDIADIADDGVQALGGEATRAGHRMAELRDFFRFAQDDIEKLVVRWRETRG